jgi:hypothetical protein
MREEHAIEIRKDLEEKLKTIGWSLHHCGCEYYRLHNNIDIPTAFLYRAGRLEIEEKKTVFGYEYGGTISADLKQCEIEIVDGNNLPFVSIRGKSLLKKNMPLFISFYNITD